MSLETNLRHVHGVAIIDVTGRLTYGPDTKVLRQALEAAYQHGDHNILLNLQGLTFVDSMGLGELVSSYADITRRGGRHRGVSANADRRLDAMTTGRDQRNELVIQR